MLHRYRFLLLALTLGLALLGWVALASRPGAQARGCPQGCASPRPRRPGPLRVMSLNMLHGFPRFARLPQRLDLIVSEIRRQDPDIVCLQEVPWTLSLGSVADHLAQRTGLNHLYLRANGNRWAILFEEGEAILSRYPLRDPARRELEPQAGFFEHRVTLRAIADTPSGPLSIVVTHLTHGDDGVNRAQAEALYAFVDGTVPPPAVVAGDLNATPTSPQIRALAGAWLDTFDAHPAPTCCIDDLAQPSASPLHQRIDYLFLVPGSPPRLRLLTSRRILDAPAPLDGGWQWASDHVGLLAEIELSP
jgi:endonuclease/exonuclease/phosphatase family metal-dependent hydrolase